LRRFFLLTALPVSLISSAVLIGVGSAQASASTSSAQAPASTRQGPAGTHCPRDGVNAALSFAPPSPAIVYYLFGDPRLGPKYLPRYGPIGKMLTDYRRFDATGPNTFLSCFWRTVPYATNWRYPKDNGFLVVHGKPVEHTVVLRPGQEIDLFGNPGNPTNPAMSKGGQFLSPAGTPYEDRALPPTNLDTYATSAPFNYHLYIVLKKFSVLAGPIAPWFDQPGGGIQDYLGNTREPDLPSSPGIANLVNRGYVQELPVGVSGAAVKASFRVIPRG
jgi:hypothetical protein